jgi:hypothetical protein
MTTLTMGVDLAAKPAKTAVCILRWGDGKPTVVMLARGKDQDGTPLDDKWISTRAAGLRNDHGEITKVGIDDPFGWPVEFLDAMTAYRSGPNWPTTIDEPRDQFCLRETDRFILGHTGKRPLSVSTNLIAIPAMRCATLLTDIARHRGVDAVARGGSGLCCEVYPDPALRHWTGGSVAWTDGKSYKGPTNSEKRRALLRVLTDDFPIADPQGALEQVELEDDYLDALICALVARAAELGQTYLPEKGEQSDLAEVEGWIHLPSGPLADLGF